MDTNAIIPVTLFIGMFGAPVAMLYFYLKFRAKKLEVINKLLEGNQAVTPELLATLNHSNASTPAQDIRLAVFYLAIGLAIFLMLVFQVFGNPAKLSLLSLLPLSIGISYWITSRFKEN